MKIKLFLVVFVLTVLGVGATAFAASGNRPSNMYTLSELYNLPNDGNYYYDNSETFARFMQSTTSSVDIPANPTYSYFRKPNTFTLSELYGLPNDGLYYYSNAANYARFVEKK